MTRRCDKIAAQMSQAVRCAAVPRVCRYRGDDAARRSKPIRFMVVHTDQRTFFSYRAECFRYTGGAHGGTIVKVGTMDARTGKQPTPADVIPAYGKYNKM